MNDLEWMARNVHEVPSYCKTISAVRLDTGEGRPFFHHDLCGTHSTQEWLAERARLQNKPSWDDAPDWANYLVQLHRGQWRWYDVKPFAEGEAWDYHHLARWKDSPNLGEVLGEFSDTLEPRPEEQPMAEKEWRGPEDGLPPVGCVAEFYVDEPDVPFHRLLENGMPVEIIAHFNTSAGYEVAAFKFEAHRQTHVEHAMPCCFRPLRTEEDRSVEEMLAIRKAYHWTDEEYCKELYRQGYRKQDAAE